MEHDTTQWAFELEDISFAWDRDEVLSVERLQLSRGERLFLGGPSGSGKSSMLSLLSGVETPQRGQVDILGTRLNSLTSSMRDQFRADHIGYIFQMFNLVPYLSVVENVCLPLKFSKTRAARVDSATAEAERLLTQLGMGDHIQRSVFELSVGQQQRVAAARALIGSPELILADEPTSALDKESAQQFIELLFTECNKAKTSLVLVSHDQDLKQHFETCYLLGGQSA
ncbi:ABC transporter ATP-binding protein [Rubritalea marina]|uniref:ABC transporter ATP-binding protein n=1 Tax=Rubritalea marina TaxID=361055 RepID=UPI00036D5BB2|nr:ATP-binding cassette domain-containing protein [Rubritalea marina]